MRQILRAVLGRATGRHDRRRRREALPDEPRLFYAVGDVHGCLDELKRLEEMILIDARSFSSLDPTIVLLGDLVDRGPASAQVIEHCLQPTEHCSRIVLAGNHEAMMLMALEADDQMPLWLENGGNETLRSYGLDPSSSSPRTLRLHARGAIPREHIELLNDLPISLRWSDHLFVHAGLYPGVALDDHDDDDLLWPRHALENEMATNMVVVHGHVPLKQPSFMPGRIAVDTGCFATGILTAVRVGLGPPRFLATSSRLS